LKDAGSNRRTFLRRLALLGAGAAGYFFIRHELVWPTPKITFAGPGGSGWMDLPAAGGLIDLPARIGGEKLRAIVDSGAQYSAIDGGLAERLALPAATPIPMVAFGVSGGPSLTRTVKVDVELGAFAVNGLRAATLNLRPLSDMTRQPFSLLLGRDFLSAVVAEVDFPRGRAAFFDAVGWRPPPQAKPVSVRVHSGELMVPVQIESAPMVEAMLDTGATGALALAEETAQAAGLLDGRPLRTGQSVTLGGVSEDGMVLARQVVFAGHTLNDVEVQIYRPAPNAPVPKGLLGLGVLQRFHVALDVGGARVFLIGPEQPPPQHPRRSTTRFTAGG
jgi:predicted aspartyl protease